MCTCIVSDVLTSIFEDSRSSGGALEFAVAVIDLAAEAKLLSLIQHPHIIKMRGLADVNYCSEDFFILLDRLNITLTEQISIWKKGLPGGYGTSIRNMKKKLLSLRGD